MYGVRIVSSTVNNEYNDEFYHNGASTAYNWGYPYPQSCSCAESGVPLSQCSIFKCQCICDVTAGKCDYNCCCDPDCSSSQINRFNSLGVCSTEGVTTSEQLCYDTATLVKVNPRSPLSAAQEQSTAASGVSQALCIEKKNVASKNEFYQDTAVESSTIFAESAGQKTYEYVKFATDETPDANYDQFDTIPVFVLDSSDEVVPASAFKLMNLPRATDFSGLCNDLNYVQFEVDVDEAENVCTRRLSSARSSSLETQCETGQSVSRYVTDLLVGSTADLGTGSSTATTSNTVPVTINKLTYIDYLTGNTTDITDIWATHWNGTEACATTYYADHDAFSAGCTGQLSSLTQQETWNSPICSGIVQSVTYYIKHDQGEDAAILSVVADVTITDVPLVNATFSTSAADDGNPDGVVASLVQQFGVRFMDVGIASGGHSNILGNVVNRTRSGNPGYLIGTNIVFGKLSSDDLTTNNSPINGTVVDEVIDGMVINTAPLQPTTSIGSSINSYGGGTSSRGGLTSTCPGVLDTSIPTTTVKFGYDLTTGCALRMNRTELAAICSSSSSNNFVNPDSGIPYFLEFINGSVGMYGNADPLDYTQWLLIDEVHSSTNTFIANDVLWNEDTGVCTGFANGLNIRFLVAYTGEKNNRQNKIVSAAYEYTTTPWKMKFPYDDSSSIQSFAMTTTVTFIFKHHQDLVGYKPPAPPLLFEVPYDVFYPFVTGAAAPSSTTGQSLMWAVVVVTVCATALALPGQA